MMLTNAGTANQASSTRPRTHVLVTGGCGFIGSHLVRRLLSSRVDGKCFEVLNLDKLTYAASPQTLDDVKNDERYHFCRVDLVDGNAVSEMFAAFQPDVVVHLAAESHVDRSIDRPDQFIQSNIVGTYQLLDVSLQYWQTLTSDRRQAFRLLHVSTDEVFGSLGSSGLFTEQTPYNPRSPYAASKAAADHLARAWHTTYGLPTIVTNSSNNYGPYQFPEKLIPHMILCAISGRELPIYGDGQNIRDWLHVEDHVSGLEAVLRCGRPGETYNLGGSRELTNLQLVHAVCDILDVLSPSGLGSYRRLIKFVADRPGHDRRYAMDVDKAKRELRWQPERAFDLGLQQTIRWYLDNRSWWQPILDGSYRLERLGQASGHQAATGDHS